MAFVLTNCAVFSIKKNRKSLSIRGVVYENCYLWVMTISHDDSAIWKKTQQFQFDFLIRLMPVCVCVCLFVYRLLCTDKLLHINESIKIYWHSANNMAEFTFAKDNRTDRQVLLSTSDMCGSERSIRKIILQFIATNDSRTECAV